MRNVVSVELEKSRMAGFPNWGLNGVFHMMGPSGEVLRIVASTAEHKMSQGWEHVSVSTKRRIPNWREMCFVKGLFWSDDECVVQFHPPQSEWINDHPRCLHLWKLVGSPFPQPPSILVNKKK